MRRKRKRKLRIRRPSGAMTTREAEGQLRKKIQQFAFQQRFAGDFDKAMARFFGEEVARTRILPTDEAMLSEFQEWFFFDHLTGSGETIIEIFARERGPRLPKEQRELLELWRQWNRYRLFEVQDTMPGTGVVVTDLLSGETLEVHDRSASHGLRRWELFLARPLYTDRLHFTGVGTVLPPTKKHTVLDYSRQLLTDFRAQHPEASLDDFYRQHGLDIRQLMQHKARERLVVITPEGHEIEICTAHYHVADNEAVAQHLEEAEEFHYAGPSADHPDALHFNWLLRGRSHVPEQPQPDGDVLMHRIEWSLGPGSPKYRSLGNVLLWPNRLELGCLSRARMEAGKALLESVLGGLIRHRRDEIESMEEGLAHRPSAPVRHDRVPPDVAEKLGLEMIYEQYENWADKPMEALDGKTPREAVQDPEGRAHVIDILKTAEYFEEMRRRAGEPWFDINQVRRELGLPIP